MPDLCFNFVFIYAHFVEPVRHILTYRQRVEQRRFLEYHTHLLANAEELLLIHAGDVVAFYKYVSFVRLVESHDQLQDRRFSGTARTDDDLCLTPHDPKRDTVQHSRIAVVFDDVLHFQSRLDHRV